MPDPLRQVRRWAAGFLPVRGLRRPAEAPLRLFEAGYLTRRRGVDPGALVFAAVDLETTGLDPVGDRVCEIAVVRFRGDGTVLGEFASLLDPGRPMGATEIHGLDDALVRGAPSFAEVLPQIERMLVDAVVVAHNLAFEDAFLDAELRRCGREPASRPPGLCTLVTARAQLEGPGYGLAALHRSMTAAPPADPHSALGDARSTAALLSALLAQAPSPLRYAGPRPRPAKPAQDDPPVRAVPRPPRAAPDVAAEIAAPADDPHLLHHWRRRELAPAWSRNGGTGRGAGTR
ncbi:3'-5' exonuclease [Streptacidiphilus rugosus]|uniref:3'-5' exonuclease n=1 Tax=Streptacidiphilus rugosus TaxID=405783 RepID=UPI00068A0BAE|nr:3'-5' exonuclease [Streptacidiphilus rugosus]